MTMPKSDTKATALRAAERIVDIHSDVLLGTEHDPEHGRQVQCPEKPCFRDRDFAVTALALIIQEELSK